MMNRGNQRPVALEDLLRLKRTERPPAEFWTQFDRELRAKQLAAIVEKRPWWRRAPSVFSGFPRYHLPLGATAVLAITVLMVREYRRPATPAAVGPTLNSVATGAIPSAIATLPAHMADLSLSAVEAAPAVSVSVLDLPDSTAASNELSPVAASVSADQSAENSERELTPTARFIATNLALAKATEPGVAQSMLGGARGFETRAVPTRSRTIDPLAQMISPSDARRSRLLAASAVAAVSMNNAQPARTTEVRARRLSDEQLYDTVSRFGAKGNSLLVKF
jgi:hypothetical protein